MKREAKVSAKLEVHRLAAYRAAVVLKRDDLTLEQVQQAARDIEAAGCYIRRNAEAMTK